MPTSPLPLETLMELAQGGDKNAYREVLSQSTRILRGFLIKRVSDKDVIEDIIQDILISIHKAQHTYDASRPFIPWMMAIARFRLTDHFRKVYREAEHEEAYTEELSHDIALDVTNPVGEYEYLYRAIETLPEKQQHVVVWMKIEGLSAKEVAEKLNMSESAVKVTAHRAYKALKIAMEQQDNE
jgi:RNA polymerase sigma-70 factor (ECF subfamily)